MAVDPSAVVLATALLFLAVRTVLAASRSRSRRGVAHGDERVLVIGASSGIGRSIAHLYAARGARVCLLARRTDQLALVVDECRARAQSQSQSQNIFGVAADFAHVEDMVRARAEIETRTSVRIPPIDTPIPFISPQSRFPGHRHRHRRCRRVQSATAHGRRGRRRRP